MRPREPTRVSRNVLDSARTAQHPHRPDVVAAAARRRARAPCRGVEARASGVLFAGGPMRHSIMVNVAIEGGRGTIRFFNSGSGVEHHEPVGNLRQTMHALPRNTLHAPRPKICTCYEVTRIRLRHLWPMLHDVVESSIHVDAAFVSMDPAVWGAATSARMEELYAIASSHGVVTDRPAELGIASAQSGEDCSSKMMSAVVRMIAPRHVGDDLRRVLLDDAAAILAHPTGRYVDDDMTPHIARIAMSQHRLQSRTAFFAAREAEVHALVARDRFPAYAGTLSIRAAEMLMLGADVPPRAFLLYRPDLGRPLFVLLEKNEQGMQHYVLAPRLDERGRDLGTIDALVCSVRQPSQHIVRTAATDLASLVREELRVGFQPYRAA